MQRFAVRLWLPDRPGTLGAVAAGIAALGGNVVGLEVLERSGDVAVDELLVELPARTTPDDLSRQLQELSGVGVEEVRPVPLDADERGLQLVGVAMAILETANPAASLAALVGRAGALFAVEWCALVDVASRSFVQATGQAPNADWLLAFSTGARQAATTGSGVMASELPDAGLVLGVGRTMPFRRREQHELDMLVRVADRMCRPLRERIPESWASRPWYLGS